jgi:PAS domain S-box-containing protein
MYLRDQQIPAVHDHSSPPRRRVVTRSLSVVAALATLACGVAYARYHYQDDRAEWIPLNRGSSEAVRQRILAWANNQFKEGADLGAALVPLAAADPRAADSVAAAVTDGRSLLGVWVVDDAGHVRAGSTRATTPDAAELGGAREVIRSGIPGVADPANTGGLNAVSLINPLPHHLALLRRLNADSTLFKLADWGQRTSETAQIVLVGVRGDTAVSLSPLRSPNTQAGQYAKARHALSQLWQLALNGADTTGYFTDERGRSVLASALSLRPLPWSVIVQVDESEVMTAPRELLEMGIAGALSFVALMLAAGMIARRSRRVKRLRKNLEEQARFREIVSSAMDAIIVVTADSAIVDVNPAAVHLFEADPADLVGSPLTAWVTSDGPDTPERALEDIASRQPRTTPYRLKLRTSEHECFIELTGSVTRAWDGTETLALFARDVTQRRRIEEALRKSGEMALLGRVAGGLAHDLNNGLHVVLGNAELLLDDADPSLPARENVEAVISGARRLARLTSELLSFGRRQMLKPEETDLVRFIREIEPDIRAELAGREKDAPRTLRIMTRALSAHVLVDRRRLREAVLHLVRNARQAMPAWGQLSIEIAAGPATSLGDSASAESAWQVIVKDSGVGMNGATVARAREPFFSTRSRAEAQGLGLAVVDGFAEQSGGTLTLKSEPGKGTTVVMSLPAHVMLRHPAEPLEIAPPTASRESRRCALIVDDEPAVRRVVARCAEALGYRAIQARHAEQALGLLADEARIDLVVSDLVMPGMDGAELRRAILRRSPTTAIVLMSGYTDDELTRRGLRDKDAVFVQKPFDRDSLMRSIDTALAVSRTVVAKRA